MTRILIVDDHAVVRQGLVELLGGVEGLDVVGSVAGGEEAIEAARTLRPDVVLMDLEMDGTDGVQATQRIKDADPHPQVVVLTSFSDQSRILAALDAGARGYLLKDAAPDELVEGIQSAAKGDRRRPRRRGRAARAVGARARRARPARRRPVQQGHRAAARHRREDGQGPPHERVPAHRRNQPRRGSAVGQAEPPDLSRLQPEVKALVLALAVLLAPAGAAQAGIIRSEDVLPAGQSGFVGADGTGSPHLYDQLPLFLSFSYKPADLNGAGSAQETPRPGVAIARDGYGVPSVTGTTEDDLWWGAGYAVAQDRLAELELFRRRGNGTLAEILGKSMLADDIVARRDYYTTPELQAMLARLPADIQARFRAYAAGVNAWIDHVRQTPADLPLEFSALKIPLRPWSVLDSLRIGVLLARTIPTGDGEELDNLAALRAFGPSTFAKILPLRVPGQITTIPAADGTFPSQPGRTRAQERAAFARSQRYVRSLPLAPVVGAAAGVPTGKASPAHTIDVGLGHLGGSFMWAIRRPSDGHTFLVNGPQLGYRRRRRSWSSTCTVPPPMCAAAPRPASPSWARATTRTSPGASPAGCRTTTTSTPSDWPDRGRGAIGSAGAS